MLHLASAIGPCVIFSLASGTNGHCRVQVGFKTIRQVLHHPSDKWSINVVVVAVCTRVVKSHANVGLHPGKILVAVTRTT
mmetsp:Transcript_3285/g.4977  ORF Transcript_3285/g.4977 Transcript_3285/m.4977 type:complete len:80 (-) Transcript_3285:34-273(-)